MINVKMEVKKGEGSKKKLVITIDLSVKGEESKSGKSMVIASTRGNQTVPGTDMKIGLNLYKPIT